MSEVESAIRVRHASPVVVHVVYIMYYVSYYPHTSRDAPVPFSKQRKKTCQRGQREAVEKSAARTVRSLVHLSIAGNQHTHQGLDLRGQVAVL